MTNSAPESLKRSLGLVDVVAIGLNGVIGTGIFFLPGMVAGMMGPASVITFLISAFLCTLLVLCFAEVGSRFSGTGGPMLYSHVAFGEASGFMVGWLTWIVRITAWGALSNGLVTAMGTLVPAALDHRSLIIVVLIATLSGINIIGVTMGARVTNFFTAAKLIPLAFFVAIGVFHIRGEFFAPLAPHGFTEVGPATLIILYAFVGFEVLTIPAGEMRDPQRSVPRALLLVMSSVTVLYLLVWAVCTGSLATLAGSENPVAEAAMGFMGPRGGGLIAFGIFLSVLGINAGSALVSPRCLYALAHEGYIPRPIGWVHPGTRTPVAAILITGAVTLVIALSGSYVELAVISVVARFAQYIPTSLAVLYFRWKRPDEEPGFRIPGGPTVPVLAVLLSIWLLIESEPRQLLWGLVALVAGLVVYLPTRILRRRAAGHRL
jgi:amino acid transporter